MLFRSAAIVYGLQVRHAHVHLVPVRGIAGELDFSNATAATDVKLKAMAEKIGLGIS